MEKKKEWEVAKWVGLRTAEGRDEGEKRKSNGKNMVFLKRKRSCPGPTVLKTEGYDKAVHPRENQKLSTTLFFKGGMECCTAGSRGGCNMWSEAADRTSNSNVCVRGGKHGKKVSHTCRPNLNAKWVIWNLNMQAAKANSQHMSESPIYNDKRNWKNRRLPRKKTRANIQAKRSVRREG